MAMISHLGRYLVGLAITFPSTLSAAGLPASFDEALQISTAVATDAANAAYQEQVLAPYFGGKYAEVLQLCFASLRTPDARSFRFVAALDAHGTVLRVYPEFVTNVFNCMYRTLVTDTFPAPPFAPYFMQVEFRFEMPSRELTARASTPFR